MSTDIIGNFSPLDELIQLIYQGIYQFVVMSSVTYDKWTVYVGMVGDAGRWWCGVWEEKDVIGAVGPNPSEKLLETFVDRLVDSIVGGELYLAGFSIEEGANIKLTFGPTSIKPTSMSLKEIKPTEAAAHATNVFLEIALQAQSRKCRLYPSTFTSVTDPTTTLARQTARGSGIEARGDREEGRAAETSVPTTGSISSSHQKIRSNDPDPTMGEAQMRKLEELTVLGRGEKERQKKRLHSPPENVIEKQPNTKARAPIRPGNAASLANPNKKARRIQALDFESDE